MTEAEKLAGDLEALQRGQEEYIINLVLYTADILAKHSYILEETEAMLLPEGSAAHRAVNSVSGRLLDDAAALRRVVRTCSRCGRYFLATEPRYTGTDPWTGEKIVELCPECQKEDKEEKS